MVSRSYRLMLQYRMFQWMPLAIGGFAALMICADAAVFLLAFAAFWIIRANPALSFLFPRIKGVELADAWGLSALGLLIVLGGVAFAILFIYQGLALPFEIVVDPSGGAIHVSSMLRTIRVPAADIHRIIIGGFLDFSMYRLVIRHTRGKIECINGFRNGDKLIDDIQALGPSIEVDRIPGLRGPLGLARPAKRPPRRSP